MNRLSFFKGSNTDSWIRVLANAEYQYFYHTKKCNKLELRFYFLLFVRTNDGELDKKDKI